MNITGENVAWGVGGLALGIGGTLLVQWMVGKKDDKNENNNNNQ